MKIFIMMIFSVVIVMSCSKKEDDGPAKTDNNNTTTGRVVAYCGEYVSASGNYHPTMDEAAAGYSCFDTSIYFSGSTGWEDFKNAVRHNWEQGTVVYCNNNPGMPYGAPPSYMRLYQLTDKNEVVNVHREEDDETTCN